MALIKSCCFWKSLRKGCFASAFYTFMYFSISCVSISLYLYDERDYLTGKVEKPTSKSFLGASPSNVLFSMMFLGCAILGTFSSVLVFIGLRKDQREFLVPWILVMALDVFIALLHFFFVIIFGNLKFEPLTGTLFTIDFFIMCLNIYCLVCIVSQYQEYKIGRGLTANHYIISNSVSHYKAPDKSCIILHPSKPSPTNNGHANFSLIQEMPKNGSANGGIKSPFQRRKAKNTILMKKQVKFIDELKCAAEVTTEEKEVSLENKVPDNNEDIFQD